MNFSTNLRQQILNSPLSWGFFFITLLLHIIWPLTNGSVQATLTTLAVLTLTVSSILSAIDAIGVKRALLSCLIVTLVALGIERIGSTTGFPFGSYSYSEVLQPQIIEVPLAVILAWFAMTWVMCVIVNDIAISKLAKAVLVGLLLTSWDFYLDPQMTASQYWIWSTTSPSLPGIPGIPLTNYLGWFLTGTLMSYIVLTFLQKVTILRTLSQLVLMWTIISGFILHAIFWGDIFVGLWGIVSMGILWTIVERLQRSIR